MKHFLDYVARSLVDNPDDVQITETSRENETTYRIGLNPGDIGLVIGKGGRTIAAIRGLVTAAGRGDRRFAIEVVENS